MGMTWYPYLRRMAIELVLFFVISSVVFYFVSGQDSVVGAINMGIIASIFYGGVTFILRQRTIRKQDER
jgi:hypothetical protein